MVGPTPWTEPSSLLEACGESLQAGEVGGEKAGHMLANQSDTQRVEEPRQTARREPAIVRTRPSADLLAKPSSHSSCRAVR
jgi:hypothetical protein